MTPFLLLTLAVGAPVTRTADLGPVRVTLALSDDTLTLADTLTATLTVEGPAPLRLPAAGDEPLTAASLSRWRVTRVGADRRVRLPGERERWTRRLRLEPFEPGDAPLEWEPVVARAGPAQQDWVARLAPVPVRVSSAVGEPALDLLRAPELDEATPEPARSHNPWWLAPLAILALVPLLRRRKPAAPAPVTRVSLDDVLQARAALRDMLSAHPDWRDLPGLAAIQEELDTAAFSGREPPAGWRDRLTAWLRQVGPTGEIGKYRGNGSSGPGGAADIGG